MGESGLRRDFWLSLSFANLVYLRAWSDLFPLSSEDIFFRRTLPGIGLYLSVAGCVLALSLVTFLLVRLASRFPVWLSRALLVAAVAMVALAIHSIAPSGFLRRRLFGLPEMAAFCLVVAVLVFTNSAGTFRLASPRTSDASRRQRGGVGVLQKPFTHALVVSQQSSALAHRSWTIEQCVVVD